jgi:hypothetical protein
MNFKEEKNPKEFFKKKSLTFFWLENFSGLKN